jgi:hypothetical protein
MEFAGTNKNKNRQWRFAQNYCRKKEKTLVHSVKVNLEGGKGYAAWA